MKTIPPELEGEYTVRVMDMPLASPGFVIFDEDDHANVYLNAHYNHETNLATCDHELAHILNDDIHNNDNIRAVETRADGSAKLKSIPHLMKASALLPPPPPKPKYKPTAHQLNVLRKCISELDAFLFDDRYEY